MNKEKKHNQYISLQEATKFCGYSQEYLSLRARQGKLKAEKFGRNWVTTKNWLKEYLKHIENYENNLNNNNIPKAFFFPKLQLPKLQLSKLQLPKLQLPKLQLPKLSKLPESLVRIAALLLITISIGTGAVFGYPYFEKKIIEPTDAFISHFQNQLFAGAGLLSDELENKKIELEKGFKKTLVSLEKIPNELKNNFGQDISFLNRNLSEINQRAKEIVKETKLGFKNIGEEISNQPQRIAEKLFVNVNLLKSYIGQDVIFLSSIFSETGQRIKEIVQETKLGLKNIGKKITEQPRKTAEKFERAIIKTAEKITEGFQGTTHFISYSIREISEAFADGYQGIVQGTKNFGNRITKVFSNGYKFLVYPWSQEISEQELIEMVLEKRPEIEKEDIENIKKEIERLKKEGVIAKEIVREVSKIVQILPEKQITKETIITKIDDKELEKLKAEILGIQKWGADIEQLQKLTQKIQSQPPQMQYVSSPVYVGSSGLEVGGAATFSSLVVSGQVGVMNLGVGGSTVLGYDANNRLTVNATSDFLSPTVFHNTLTVGTGSNYFRVDANGNLSIVGTLTVVGTTTASTYISDSDDSTVRKIGEEVMREMVSIYRFGIPSQTSATSSYVRISKIIKENPFTDKPEVLPGATRVYRFNIKYADDLAVGEESLWRIYDIDNSTTTATFVLPRTGESGTLEEGASYITGLITIPTAQWQLELKLPTSGKSIRIFDIFLSAYDEIL